MPRRYYKPFSGKPAPLELSGLFLFDPFVDIRLLGHSMRGLLSEVGKESLFKGMERSVKQQRPPSQRLIRELLSILPSSPLRAEFDAALNGDEAAQACLNARGPWEIFLGGAVPQESNLLPHGRFLLAVERSSAEPLRLIQVNRIAEAREALLTDPLMAKFLWPEALQLLARATEKAQLIPLQASVALEVRLAALACWDVHLEASDGAAGSSRLRCLLPTPEKPSTNPIALLFRALKIAVGARSITKLLDDRRLADLVNDGALSEATLKRWSCGSRFPDEGLFRKLLDALFSDEEALLFWNMYWGARQLTLMGYIAQAITERARVAVNHEQKQAWSPWPSLPFGCDSFEQWCHTRYPQWLAFHWEQQL